MSANALTLEHKLADPVLEQNAAEVFNEIRCMVCSGESIADSRADLARELRKIIREKIQAGATNNEVIDALVVSYGDSILMRPPLKNDTILLWFGPVLLLLLGFAGAAVFFYSQKHKNNLSL